MCFKVYFDWQKKSCKSPFSIIQSYISKTYPENCHKFWSLLIKKYDCYKFIDSYVILAEKYFFRNEINKKNMKRNNYIRTFWLVSFGELKCNREYVFPFTYFFPQWLSFSLLKMYLSLQKAAVELSQWRCLLVVGQTINLWIIPQSGTWRRIIKIKYARRGEEGTKTFSFNCNIKLIGFVAPI